MFNPSPLPIKTLNLIAFFTKMSPDIVILLCRYLTIRDVEAMGLMCRAAHAQFLKLKQRPDFWNSLVPLGRHLKNDWGRSNPTLSLRPEIWQGSES